MNAVSKKKVLVMGIDGATFDIILPLIEKGKLRNFRSLLSEASWGTLLSTIPPNSSVAWSSFMTGKRPENHGVYYFRERRGNNYDRPLVNARSVRAKTLWKILSERQKKVVVVNVPMTYPPEEVNGCLIAGLLTPRRTSMFTHPPELHLELINAVGDYPLESEAIDLFWKSRDEIAAYTHLVYMARKVFQTAEYLLTRKDWDFAMVMFSLADKVQHVFWKYTEPEYQARFPEQCAKMGRTIEYAYELLDELLGEILKIAGDSNVILVSDHGFGAIEEKFYINRWLRNEGLLRVKKGGHFRFNPLQMSRNLLVGSGVGRLLPSRLLELAKKLRRSHLRVLASAPQADDLCRIIDWSKTRAYSSWTGGEEVVYINLKGREPEGIVAPGAEYEDLRDEIISKLLDLRDNDGKKVVEKAYKREEIYPGRFMELAPDIQFVTRDMAVLPKGEIFGTELFVKPIDRSWEYSPAIHRINGIFFMKGEDVQKGRRLEDSNIWDVAPTILHLLDLPIPDDMDGKCLESAFCPDYIKNHPITLSPASSESMSPESGADVFDNEEQMLVKQHLQGLGYME